MDHISNYLNFSLGGNQHTPSTSSGDTYDTVLPQFTDLPLTEDIEKKPDTSIDVFELRKRLYALKDEVASIIRLLELSDGPIARISPAHIPSASPTHTSETINHGSGDRVLEGVFNGDKFVGHDGQEYAVPPNYASKSKLVEGDHMKLTITPHGKFIYKQIGPIERKRIIGVLHFDEATQLWSVLHEGKSYKILTASVTFYKGKPSDHVVILVPKEAPSDWGAVENIISS